MKKSTVLIFLICCLSLTILSFKGGESKNRITANYGKSNRDKPLNVLQQEFADLRYGMFIHFNMATFVDKEWATGYEDPLLFNPSKLDCRQWARVIKSAGMKYAVLTVKHTGGWCLWDSKYTTHDISAFKN